MKETIIKAELLCKSFISDGEVNNIIKNMNLEIYKGDFTVIMGSSGSGKSTLLYCLSGLDEVSGGKVFMEDVLLTSIGYRKMSELRREKMGYVFQGINLIDDLTVMENIMCPTYRSKEKKELLKARAEELISSMHLGDDRNKYPSQLSGGQAQKVAICRALINQPQILMADEPTGALNSAQGKEVLDLFSQIHENGQSIVMVTHDLKAAIRGNRILFLRDGRIDGDLALAQFKKENEKDREDEVYQFLKSRDW